jgi:hypothetical protein
LHQLRQKWPQVEIRGSAQVHCTHWSWSSWRKGAKKIEKKPGTFIFHYISSYFNVWNETFWGSETPKLVFFWRLRSLAMQQSAFLNKHLSSFGGPE